MHFAHRTWSLRLLSTLIALLALSGCGARSELPDGHDAAHGGTCDETTCPSGCCTAEGTCTSGTSNAACGGGGNGCAVCSAGESCSAASRTCVEAGGCNTTTCPGGCCDTNDKCQSGTALTACGSAGGACANCAAAGFASCDPMAQACVGPQSGCDPTTCPGCCEPNGVDGLKCVAGTADTACGRGGANCGDCFASGLVCNPFSQTCRPAPCDSTTCPTGCCDTSGFCESGTSTASCGNGGKVCTPCPPGDTCNAGGCQGATCNASICPTGCCDSFGKCEAGTVPLACGTGGAACLPCPPSDTCFAGSCQGPLCNAATCPRGCCDTSGFCESGTSTSACGEGGNACSACPPDDICSGGTCQAIPCNASTCPTGCCDSAHLCETGRSTASCGNGGKACAPCPPADTCNTGSCQGTTCNAATCPKGCCDGLGNCEAGNSTSACGSNGNACLPCPPGGSCAAGACKGAPCNAATCPTGCCDPFGFCETGTSTGACGKGGDACAACPPDDACRGGACQPIPCNLMTCPTGCCDVGGVCETGTSTMSCGNGGQACTACPPGDMCNAGSCQGVTCNTSNCAMGCCDSLGMCESGTSTSACGTGAKACLPCPPSDSCSAGTCTGPACNASTCPTGCCDALGFCESGTITSACGTKGTACTTCPPGDTCNTGSCQASTCNAMTCPTGCCDTAGACQTGTTLNDCGAGGKACAACGPADACVGGVCQGATCGFQTCPDGCCDQEDICQPGTAISDCGSGGSVCVTCSGRRASCPFGFCQRSVCNASTCPTGCCDSSGECQPGNQTFDCGSGGAFCEECDFDQVCEAGACANTACNSYSCDGCCDANNACQPGTTNADCGFDGNQCASCPTAGFCLQGACGGFVCGPTTCPEGCCDGSGNCQTGFGFVGGATCPCSETCSGCCDSMNSCHGGTVSTECGSEGALCVDCTALGETCDSDVFPVACDMSCPTPYPGCAPGTTMPAPILAPGACHSFDLSDAATACVAGAQTVDCQNFFSAEFGVNSNCANCLSQFDVDFADFTAIYLCAEPILSGSCDMSTGCANDCINVACEECQETTCQSTASNGECSSFVTAGNACIAGSPPATALCAQSSYPSFGAWLQGVGAKYCE